MPHHAGAQGRVEARYTAALAGIPIGRGTWVIDIGADQYTTAASGRAGGVLRLFANGEGTGAARGAVNRGRLVAGTFSSAYTTRHDSYDVRMGLAGGAVKDLKTDPPYEPSPDRVPLTDAHRRGVVDPMTGSLLRVPGSADPVGPEACRAGGAVFDGRMRYELKLDYKRMEHVRAERGYAGPAVVCAVYFTPVAGYIPDRAVIKHLAAQRNIEAWFAPIAGTRILVPFRMTVPTPFGTGVLEATQFVSTATPPRVAKTQ